MIIIMPIERGKATIARGVVMQSEDYHDRVTTMYGSKVASLYDRSSHCFS